jgi:hypothetical protein
MGLGTAGGGSHHHCTDKNADLQIHDIQEERSGGRRVKSLRNSGTGILFRIFLGSMKRENSLTGEYVHCTHHVLITVEEESG